MFGASTFGTPVFGVSGEAAAAPVDPVDPVDPVIPSPPDSRDYVYTPGYDLPVPSSFDLLQYAGSIEDQKTTNSCLANATVSALEILLSRSKSFKDLSRLYLYWYLRKGTSLAGSDGGAYPRDGFRVANKQGLCDESTWPFIPSAVNSEPSTSADNEAATLKAYKYQSIICGRSTTASLIKTAIACGYPVVLSANISASFQQIAGASLFDTAAQFIPTSQGGTLGGHALNAIGYTSDGMLLIENSWGTSWGAGGYAYVPMDSFLTDVFEAWTCTGLNGVTIPPLLARPVWEAAVKAPALYAKGFATASPKHNLATLESPIPLTRALGGANALLAAPLPWVSTSATAMIFGAADLSMRMPSISISGKLSVTGYAELTFGYSNGRTYTLDSISGSSASVKLPKLSVSISGKFGAAGASRVALPKPTISSKSGASAKIVAPRAIIASRGVKGCVVKLSMASAVVSASASAGGLGKTRITSPGASVVARGGWVVKMPSPKMRVAASGIKGSTAKLSCPRFAVGASLKTGAIGSIRVSSAAAHVFANKGGVAQLVGMRVIASGNSRSGVTGRLSAVMPRPAVKGHTGGVFKGVLP